jgi:3-isopropylmalate dehydratase small subunit
MDYIKMAKLGILAIILVSFCSYFFYLKFKVSALTSEVDRYRIELQIEKANSEKLSSAIDLQNKKIDAYKADIAKSEEAKKLVESKIRGMQVDSDKIVQEILNRKIPLDCEESIRSLRNAAPSLRF